MHLINWLILPAILSIIPNQSINTMYSEINDMKAAGDEGAAAEKQAEGQEDEAS